MTLIHDQLREFILDTCFEEVSSRWLQAPEMKVYVRKSKRVVVPDQKELITCLDIATVEVEEKHRGQGKLTEFLEYAHQHNPWRATFIESVGTERLQNFLLRNNWKESTTLWCFFKYNGEV